MWYIPLVLVTMLLLLTSCTTIQSVSSGPDGHLYVAATQNYLLYSTSYLLDCTPAGSGALDCARMLDAQAFGQLAPETGQVRTTIKLDSMPHDSEGTSGVQSGGPGINPAAPAPTAGGPDATGAVPAFERFLAAAASGDQSLLRATTAVVESGMPPRSLSNAELTWVLSPSDYGAGAWRVDRIEPVGGGVLLYVSPSGGRTLSGARGEVVLMAQESGAWKVQIDHGKWYQVAPPERIP